jgi:hypothetical protein
MTTPAAAAAETTPATAATPRSAACRLGPRFIDVQGPSVQLRSVQLRDRSVGIAFLGHFHERKSTGLARVTIRNDVHSLYVSIRGEGSQKIFLRCLVAEVSNENVSHGVPGFKLIVSADCARNSSGRRGTWRPDGTKDDTSITPNDGFSLFGP